MTTEPTILDTPDDPAEDGEEPITDPIPADPEED